MIFNNPRLLAQTLLLASLMLGPYQAWEQAQAQTSQSDANKASELNPEVRSELAEHSFQEPRIRPNQGAAFDGRPLATPADSFPYIYVLDQQGNSVEYLQYRLNKLGYPAPSSGRFDSDTQSALKAFQAARGISETGWLGPVSRKSLDSLEQGRAPEFEAIRSGQGVAQVGHSGKTVEELQSRLSKLGFGVQETGIFGETTAKTLLNFQKQFALMQTAQLGKTTLEMLKNVETRQSPELIAVRDKQAALQIGQHGEAIYYLQSALIKRGFEVEATGRFDLKTQKAVSNFQERLQIEADGVVGYQTLIYLEHTSVSELNGATGSDVLAQTARQVAQSRGTVGWCYNAVYEAVTSVYGDFLRGEAAYMAADQLALNPRFERVTVAPDDLPKLPAGMIVVWGQTELSPFGHISVTIGGGMEASDHIDYQRSHLRGFQNVQVFRPVG